MADLRALGDEELVASLRGLELRHRQTMAGIVEHLLELERRGLHLSLGYPSLYEYCLRALGLSEDEAFRRITVARMAAKQPVLLDGLADGSLHLSGLVALSPHFRTATPDAAAELLEMAHRQSRREIERRLAARFPQADAPDVVRGRRGKIDPLAPGRYRVQLTIDQASRDKLERALELLSHQNPEHALAPVFAAALEALVEKLERAKRAKLVTREGKAARRAKESDRGPRPSRAAPAQRAAKPTKRTQPSNEPPAFDERQLDLWELAATNAPPAPARVNPDAPQQESPTKAISPAAKPIPAMATKSPQATKPMTRPKSPSRHIPRSVRRATFERASGGQGDGGGCCFVSEDGQRCGSRHFLELDHETPWAIEQRHRPANLRVLCGAHNRLVARELSGSAGHQAET